jgi:hypothetical protein
MKMAEIRERYTAEWVLIKFGSMTDLTEELEVIEGEVVAHAHTRDEIYRVEKQLGPENYALEFLGDFPEDEDVGYILRSAIGSNSGRI